MKRAALMAGIALVLLAGLYPGACSFLPTQRGLLSTRSAEWVGDLTLNRSLYLHLGFAGLALLTGWCLFLPGLRDRRLSLHRALGRIYLLAVAVSGLTALQVARHAAGGWISTAGVSLLSVTWLVTTGAALWSVLAQRIEDHRDWMTYSYAATLATVTVRLWIPALTAITGDVTSSSRAAAWLCWVPFLFVAWLLVRRRRGNWGPRPAS